MNISDILEGKCVCCGGYHICSVCGDSTCCCHGLCSCFSSGKTDKSRRIIDDRVKKYLVSQSGLHDNLLKEFIASKLHNYLMK
jgi:hypothetical protein